MLCILFLCIPFLATPPGPVAPDGAGGFVPFTNSRVMPDGTLRPYDPELDGFLAPDGSIAPPRLRGSIEPGNTPRHIPRYHAAKPPGAVPSDACYGPDGKPLDPVPDHCRTDSAPPIMPNLLHPEASPQASPGPGAAPDPDHERVI
jgi:hypothetical protein